MRFPRSCTGYEGREGMTDWSCEAMWNSFIASFLFEHETVESLLRELRRNKQLRMVCGFEPKGVKQKDGSIKVYVAPSTSAYSKFLKNLISRQEELNEMFAELVRYMYGNLEYFGEILMVDGKAVQSYGTKPSKKKKSGCRGEHDADWCKKQYSASGPNYFLGDKGYDSGSIIRQLEGKGITPVIDNSNYRATAKLIQENTLLTS